MKGYRMVLLVNGGLFLFLALAALLLSSVMRTQAEGCRAENPADLEECDQTATVANTTRTVSPILFAIGLVLLVLGIVLGRKAKA